MTLTAERADVQTSEPFARLLPVLLIGAPALMAVARLLLVPINSDDYDKTLTDMAAAHVRSDAGWLLAMAASSLLALTAVHLCRRLARAGRERSAAFALLTTAIGWAGCSAICLAGLVLSAAGRGPDRAAQVAVQKSLDSGSTTYVFLMVLVGALGYVVLAVAMARARMTTKGGAVLLALGGLGTLITMAGPVTPLLVLSSLLLLAGHVLTARTAP